MFACRVLLGKQTGTSACYSQTLSCQVKSLKGRIDDLQCPFVLISSTTLKVMRGKPLPVAQNDYDSYANGSIFVARHADQVLPRYLVEFEYDNGAGGYALPGGMPNIINNPAGLFGAMFAGGAGGYPGPVPGPAAAAVPPLLDNGWNPYVQTPAAQPRLKRARKAPARKAAAARKLYICCYVMYN